MTVLKYEEGKACIAWYSEKSALVIIDIQEKLMKVMSDRDQVGIP